MVTTTLKEIEAARAKLAQLEAAHAEGLKSELAALPAKYGFDTVKAFIKAVKGATGTQGRGNGKDNGRRRRRALVTDEIRASVVKMAKDGKKGAEIAKKVGISLPTVQNIKKAAGLVKARKK